jgi:hypothetical protein
MVTKDKTKGNTKKQRRGMGLKLSSLMLVLSLAPVSGCGFGDILRDWLVEHGLQVGETGYTCDYGDEGVYEVCGPPGSVTYEEGLSPFEADALNGLLGLSLSAIMDVAIDMIMGNTGVADGIRSIGEVPVKCVLACMNGNDFGADDASDLAECGPPLSLQTSEVSCTDLDSVYSMLGLRSGGAPGGRDTLGLVRAAKSPMASFAGSLHLPDRVCDAAHSTGCPRVHIVTHAGSADPRVTGEISVRGGRCRAPACPLEIEYLKLHMLTSFTMDGALVSDLYVRNDTFMRGEIDSDGNFVIFKNAMVMNRATVEGETHQFPLVADADLHGRIDWSGDAHTPSTLTLEGSFEQDGVSLSFDSLTFHNDRLAPQASFAILSKSFTSCPDREIDHSGAVAFDRLMHVFDGRGSFSLSGSAIVRYTWFDGDGQLLGSSDKACWGVGDCTASPIKLQVETADGRVGSTVVGEEPWLSYPDANERFASALAVGDFNGDMVADLVVGVPYENGPGDVEKSNLCAPDPDGSDPNTTLSAKDAGAVQIIYGSKWGAVCDANEIWTQDPLSSSSREDNDRFGHSVATGDFDGDGYDDVVIGVPYEDWGSKSNTGIVHILYGASRGLENRGSANAAVIYQDRRGVAGVVEAGDEFGMGLAAGDFNGDGVDDLAVGVPGEDRDQGIVQVFFGRAGEGLTYGTIDQLIRRSDLGVPAVAKDKFGYALETGDFNNDGLADLVVGAHGADGIKGAVHVLHGTAMGLSTTDVWNVAAVDLPVASQMFFGWALAVGHFNNDAYLDLAVGSPLATVSGKAAAGSVSIFFGSDSGLRADNGEILSQNTTYYIPIKGGAYLVDRVPDIAEVWDNFGYSLRVGRIDGDALDDLVVGVPGEKVGSVTTAGLVHVFYSHTRKTNTFDLSRDQVFKQDDLRDGLSESGDRFGHALALGDLDGNGLADLVIGAPTKDVDVYSNAGEMFLIYGSDAHDRLDASYDSGWVTPQNTSINQGGTCVADPMEVPF